MASRVGWAFHLAGSWTWSIALFLPVIVKRDVGDGVWPLIWLCNVGGATAFAFVMSRERSAAFLHRHMPACRVFSLVTIVGQALFAGWVVSRLPPAGAAAALATTAAACFAVGRGALPGLSVAVWLATVAVFAASSGAGPNAGLGATLAAELAWQPHAFYALPLIFTGFVFSPYLDLTFHGVMRRSSDDRAARIGFLIGFPLLFSVMLLFALSYRDELAPLMLDPPVPGTVPPLHLQLVLGILVLQAGVTAALHMRETRPGQMAVVVPAVAAVAGLGALLIGDLRLPTGHGLNELLYRTLIGFYGVLVPAYVWMTAGTPARPAPLGVLLAALALLAAAVPMLVSPEHLALYGVAFALMVPTRWAGGWRRAWPRAWR